MPVLPWNASSLSVKQLRPVSEAAACKASAIGYREQTYISMYFFMQAFDGWTLLLLAGQVVLLPRHGFWHILAKNMEMANAGFQTCNTATSFRELYFLLQVSVY
jgi:hypothetical protein